MHAEIHQICKSSSGTVLSYCCREEPGSVSSVEAGTTSDIVFTRRGRFTRHRGRKSHDVHCQMVLLENRGDEHVVSHGKDVRDECTFMSVKPLILDEALRSYWRKNHLPAGRTGTPFPVAALPVTPSLDYLHMQLFHRSGAAGTTLRTDLLFTELVREIFRMMFDDQVIVKEPEKRLEELHLETIERAKHHITLHFREDISLSDIAYHACVSEFHFSRLFKHFTAFSPYQYLIELRLKHATLLLRNTSLPVTDVCFESGFNSIAHFIATFTRRHGLSPSRLRAA